MMLRHTPGQCPPSRPALGVPTSPTLVCADGLRGTGVYVHLFMNTVFLYTVIFYAMISQQNSSAILVCYFRLGENVADIFTVKLLFFF